MKILLLLSVLFFALPLWAKPLVVTTIRPMTLLVEAIAGDSVEIRQLLPNSEVPHHYSLRIADRALLAQADLLLWVGPELESFLANSVTALRPEKVITATDLPGIQWPTTQLGEQKASKDPHIWLNPKNGRVIATEVGNWLAAHYPGQREQILAAQQRFKQQLDKVFIATAAKLTPLSQHPFIVDHDAFGHFGEAFTLHPSGALKTNSGLSAGARQLHQLLNQGDIHCIIAEPRHNPGRVAQIAKKLNAKIAIIDPLGADIPPSRTAYLQLIEGVGDKIAACLSPATSATNVPPISADQ